MADVYDENVEQAMLARLHAHEADRQAAERRLANVRAVIEYAGQGIAHWQFVIDDYRKSCGLPSKAWLVSPILEETYSGMGPTELVLHWAGKHDGEVVIKDLAKESVKAGVFPTYRQASSAIYSVLKRKPFTRVGPGHFRQLADAEPANGHHPSMVFEPDERLDQMIQ